MNKYKAIVKVSNDRFVKYHVDNLLSFTKFLDKNFPDWRFMNIFLDGKQIANYTNKQRPSTKKV